MVWVFTVFCDRSYGYAGNFHFYELTFELLDSAGQYERYGPKQIAQGRWTVVLTHY